MPTFNYTARTRTGQTVTDALYAPSRKDALRLLAARGFSPVNVSEAAPRPAPGKRKTASASPFSPAAPAAEKTPATSALSRRERLPFLESLVDLTSSGLSAGESVRLLSLRVKETRLRLVCKLLWEQVSEGAQLSRAMGSLPAVFDASSINLIQSGEATGNLNEVLQRLITHLQEEKELRQKVLSALAYPSFLMLVAGGVILFFMVVLLPQLQKLFLALGGQLPLSTRILLGSYSFGLRYGVFLVVGMVLGAVSFWRWRRTAAGRHQSDGWLLRLPVVGPFVVSKTILAFSQTLSVLLENGITTSEALRMTERQIENRVHRAAFASATDRVLEGEALSSALSRTGCFPDLVLDQLAVGENTGNLVPSLKKLAATYQKTIAYQLKAFTGILGTVMLLGVFVFVGFIAYAIVSAVFQLSSSFKM